MCNQYKKKILPDILYRALLGFEPRISCLRERRFTRLSYNATVPSFSRCHSNTHWQYLPGGKEEHQVALDVLLHFNLFSVYSRNSFNRLRSHVLHTSTLIKIIPGGFKSYQTCHGS